MEMPSIINRDGAIFAVSINPNSHMGKNSFIKCETILWIVRRRIEVRNTLREMLVLTRRVTAWEKFNNGWELAQMEPWSHKDRPRHEKNEDRKSYAQYGGLCGLRTVGFKILFVELVKAKVWRDYHRWFFFYCVNNI